MRSWVLVFLLAGCVAETPRPAVRAKPAAPATTTDSVAFEAERRLNSAERALDELKPDEAKSELEVADKALDDPKIENYPEAKELRARYRTLLGRVPDAREELRKRDLAAAVAAAKEKIEEARAGLKAQRSVEGIDAVRAALDAAGELEAKDPEYSKYSLAVRKDLQTQKAALGKAYVVASIAEAKKLFSSRLRSEAEIQAAEAAADEVEKALEANAGDPKFSTETRKFLANYRKRLKDQAAELGADGLAGELRAKLDSLASALAGVGGISPDDAAFKAVAEAIDDVKKALAAGAEMEHKSGRYNEVALGARKKLRAAQQKIEARKAELAGREQRTKIEEVMAAAKTSVEAAKAADATESTAKDAEAAVKTAREQLVEGLAWEKKDPSYGRFAAASRKKLAAMRKTIDAARMSAMLRTGPLAAAAEGKEHLKTAKTQTGEEQAASYVSAMESFRRCRKDAEVMQRFEIANQCAMKEKGAAKKLASAKRDLAFYSGPGKAWEKGKASSQEGDTAGAIGAFQECLASGRLLLHQQPELKSRKFEFRGGQVTIGRVLGECKKELKSLRAGQAIQPTS